MRTFARIVSLSLSLSPESFRSRTRTVSVSLSPHPNLSASPRIVSVSPPNRFGLSPVSLRSVPRAVSVSLSNRFDISPTPFDPSRQIVRLNNVLMSTCAHRYISLTHTANTHTHTDHIAHTRTCTCTQVHTHTHTHTHSAQIFLRLRPFLPLLRVMGNFALLLLRVIGSWATNRRQRQEHPALAALSSVVFLTLPAPLVLAQCVGQRDGGGSDILPVLSAVGGGPALLEGAAVP